MLRSTAEGGGSRLEAITWRGGEAAGSRAAFEALSAADRAAITAFLDSL